MRQACLLKRQLRLQQTANFVLVAVHGSLYSLYWDISLKIFQYKQKMLFYQGDLYLWPHCCMKNLYISHRSLYAPTYSFRAIHSMLISLFRVTSWVDTVYNIVTRWVNFRKKSCMNVNYNIWLRYLEVFWPNIYVHVFLVLFTVFQFDLEKFISKIVNIYFSTRNLYILDENTSKYRSRIFVVHVHANVFF